MKHLLLVAALTVSLHVSAQSAPTLAQIPLTLEEQQQTPLGDRIYFEFVSNKAPLLKSYLAAYQGISVKLLDDDKLAIAMTSQPRFAGEVKSQYSQASFVIDTDEPATQTFINGFSEKQNTAQLYELTAYVSQYIDDPTYIHGFNLASTVATQRAGDCTEFATLTTALARGLGLSARMALGTVIVEQDQQVSAFGHAWTEVWFKGKWQIIDAALYGAENQHFYYLPVGTLDNEGPGFAMALASVSTHFPSRIEKVQSLKR